MGWFLFFWFIVCPILGVVILDRYKRGIIGFFLGFLIRPVRVAYCRRDAEKCPC